MASAQSWMNTKMKMMVNDSDEMIAGVMMDGCNMGIKSLYKYMNQYQAADNTSRDICNRLISIEETLRHDLRDYL